MPTIPTHYRRGYVRKDGRYVPPAKVPTHERHPPRTVEVSETAVKTFFRHAYFRADGTLVRPTFVQGHVRQAHKRSKPQR